MDVLENLKKLPERCAATMPGTGEPILIKRGVRGYWPLKPGFDVDGYNKRHGVNRYQVDAMLVVRAEGPSAAPVAENVERGRMVS